jgi:hypothetical protein
MAAKLNFLNILIFLGFGFLLNAQEVTLNGEVYQIKKEQIFKDGMDVTESLSFEEKKQIWANFNQKMIEIKESEKIRNKLKKAEKEQRTAQKRQKKVENTLKQKEKEQSRFDKAEKKYNDALKKYDKLKSKGKLSPEDDKKWLDKIEGYNKALLKAKRKL